MIIYLLGCIISCIACTLWLKLDKGAVRVGDIIPLIIVTFMSWASFVVGVIFWLGKVIAENEDKELF